MSNCLIFMKISETTEWILVGNLKEKIGHYNIFIKPLIWQEYKHPENKSKFSKLKELYTALVTQCSLTATNTWDNHLISFEILKTHSFWGFSPWMVGYSSYGPVMRELITSKEWKWKGLGSHSPLQGHTYNDQKTFLIIY